MKKRKGILFVTTIIVVALCISSSYAINADNQNTMKADGSSDIIKGFQTIKEWQTFSNINEINSKLDPNKNPVLTGDWNGDGKTDIAYVSNAQVKTYVSTPNGWDTGASINDLSPGQSYTDIINYPIITGDWNGDGKTDIARVSDEGVRIYTSTGTGWIKGNDIPDFGIIKGYKNSTIYPIITGDWNGDGKTDIARVRDSGVEIYTSTGTDWENKSHIPDFGTLKGYSDSTIYPIITGDWNGDGKTDIARVRDEGVRIYTSTGTDWIKGNDIPDFGIIKGYKNSTIYPIITGDWNGDGKTDIARVRDSGVEIYTSTGAGWGNGAHIPDFGTSKGYSDSIKYPIITGDWNGDWKTDIARVCDAGVKVYVSTDNNWQPYIDFIDTKNYPLIITGDWNGDWKTDIGFIKTDKLDAVLIKTVPVKEPVKEVEILVKYEFH